MPRYVLSQEAQADLREIQAYYLRQANAQTAQYVLGAITRAFRFLAATPGAGHSRTDLTDEPVKLWPVFSYLIVYDPAAQPIGIARVRHSSQDLATLFRTQPPRV